MKRICAFLVSLCVMACMAMPALASETADEFNLADCEIISAAEFDGQQLATFEVTVGDNGTPIIKPMNVDLIQVSGPYWQDFVNVSTGKNMKVHVNIQTIIGSVNVYCKPNSAAGALSNTYLKATWTGTGHHWADLVIGTTYTKYYVILWGNFTGTGAVYTEP